MTNITKFLNGKTMDEIIEYEKKKEQEYQILLKEITDHMDENSILFFLRSYLLFLKKQEISKISKNKMILEKNSKDFKEIDQLYQMLLQDLSKIIQKYNFQHPIEVFSYYFYLLSHGYLSKDQQFYYNEIPSNSIYLFSSLDVIEGKGCCINISPFLTDLLNIQQIESYNMYLYTVLDSVYTFNQFHLNEQSSSINQDILKDRQQNFLINHMATLVTYHNNSYFLDPTNNTLFFIDSSFKVHPIHQKDHQIPVTYERYMNENKSKKEVYKAMTKPTTEKLKRLQQQYNKTWKICENSKETFDLFFHEHKELYEEVIEKKKMLYQKQKNFFGE